MKVKEVVGGDPITASPHLTLADVARIMEAACCAFVPIVDAGKPVGVVTDRDLTIRATAHGKNAANTMVETLMSRPPVVVDGEADIADVAKLMLEKNVRRLLVLKPDGTFLGVVSVVDLAGKLSDQDLAKTIQQFAMQNHPNPTHRQPTIQIPGLYFG